MAKINANDTIQQMIRELQLDPLVDKVPLELADKVLATYALNDRWLIDVITINLAISAPAIITVPDNEIWEVVNMHVQLTTSATAGSRQIRIQVTDGSTLVHEGQGAIGSVAANTVRKFTFSPLCTGAIQNAAGRANYVHFIQWLLSGWVLTFDDLINVDTADVIQVYLQIRRHKK